MKPLIKRMGIEALYRRPLIHRYLLGDLEITRPIVEMPVSIIDANVLMMW